MQGDSVALHLFWYTPRYFDSHFGMSNRVGT